MRWSLVLFLAVTATFFLTATACVGNDTLCAPTALSNCTCQPGQYSTVLDHGGILYLHCIQPDEQISEVKNVPVGRPAPPVSDGTGE